MLASKSMASALPCIAALCQGLRFSAPNARPSIMVYLWNRLLFIIAAAAFVSGCSSANPPNPPITNEFVQLALLAPKGQALLYVSSNYSYENVYSFPQGKLLQTLTIPGGPQALCTDKLGDVYIPQAFGEIVAEYPHGGTAPIGSWEFRNVAPQGCAVDPFTGNVAVAGGKVVIFGPSGNANVYSNSAVEDFYYATYDAGSNLFVVAYTFASGYQLWELRKGSSTLKQVTLPFDLCCPEDVQWDGQYLAIGGPQGAQKPTIVRLEVKAYRAKIRGRVHLSYPQSYTSQFWIQGSRLIHSDYGGDDVAFFKYPAGGSPTKVIKRAGPYVVGITVSVARK